MHEDDAIQEDDLENIEDAVMMLRELRESVEGMVNDGELCDFGKRHENLVMFIKERIKHHVFRPNAGGLSDRRTCREMPLRFAPDAFGDDVLL